MEHDFTAKELVQLWQWHLWQTKENFNHGLPDTLREQCHRAIVATATTISTLQKDVVSQLVSMGLDPREEYLTPCGYSIDALVEVNSMHIAIEVDGPSHFIGRKPNGATLLKWRQVSGIDKILLISVPYWEWNELGKDPNRKQQYLQNLLRLIVSEKSSCKQHKTDRSQLDSNVSDDLNSLTVVELKEILRSKGLKVGGRKAELVERLELSQ